MFGTYRTLLALMVVVYHLGGVPVIGEYAVFGFYSLSGYLMTLIMHDSYGYTWIGKCKYALNRFLRIYPIYWVSIVISLLLIWFLNERLVAEYHGAFYLPATAAEILRNIFLFFPFREEPRLTIPAWALTVELFYYICIGLGLSRSRWLTWVWLVVSAAYHIVLLVTGAPWQQRYFPIPAASLPFATGALIYHYREQLLDLIDALPSRLDYYLPVIMLGGFMLNWTIGTRLQASHGIFFYTNYALCSLMVAVLLNRKSLPWISRPFDKWMGDLSYPIYLVHYQGGLLTIAIFAYFGMNLQRHDPVMMAFSLPVILLMSVLMTKIVERPIEMIRSMIKKAW